MGGDARKQEPGRRKEEKGTGETEEAVWGF